MVVIDTSVWIDFFRSKSHACKDEVVRLLDEDLVCLPYPVYAELLNGVGVREYQRLQNLLLALPVYYPTQQTCELLTGMITQARKHGFKFAFADLLIAALGHEAGAKIWSFDADFSLMQKAKLVKLHFWKG